MNKKEIIFLTILAVVVILTLVSTMTAVVEEKEKFMTWCTEEYSKQYKDVTTYCKLKESGKVR